MFGMPELSPPHAHNNKTQGGSFLRTGERLTTKLSISPRRVSQTRESDWHLAHGLEGERVIS